jgi:protein SCO1
MLPLLLAACSQPPEPKRYELVGQILAIAPERGEVTIKHEDIKNFMPGMTMPFTVEDAALLDGRQPGDLVTATLVVGDTAAHLENLRKTVHRGLEPPDPAAAPAGLRAGDIVADAPLVDQSGTARTLASLRGHRVALTFAYTRCPLPEYCPLMDRRFAALQRTLRTRPDLADVRLLTITLDPEYDTPAVLTSHAATLKADAAVWSFLTGPTADVSRFAEQFGIYREVDPAAPAQITHTLRTAVIGHDGRLITNRSGTDWTPDDLLADLAKAPAPVK